MIILRQRNNKNTVRVWHTTSIQNLQSIYQFGLLRSYQRSREFEQVSLGLDRAPGIYLSKDLEHLCIPPKEGKRVVLQIDIPVEYFKKWDKVNKGDPMYQYYLDHRNKFRTWEDFTNYMLSEMKKQDPKLKSAIDKEILEYGCLENTPRYKHAINSEKALMPSSCLMFYDDIKPEWIQKEYLTEKDLARKGIYFGR